MLAGPLPVKESGPALVNAATPANWFAFRISRKIGSENEHPLGFAAPKRRLLGQSPEDIYPLIRGAFRALHRNMTSSDGFSTGSDRSITASIRLKIAVFAPIPSTSVSTATAAKPGELRSMRIP